MRTGILLLLGAALFASCGSLTNYWHEEEDDVYFVSDTQEDVDVIIYSDQSDGNTETNNRTVNTGTQRPVLFPGVNNRRVTRRSNDPNYCPPGTTPRTRRTSTPRTSTPRTSTPRSSSPAPTRQSRPRPTPSKTSTPR